CCYCVFISTHRLHCSPLFPYSTLFRSVRVDDRLLLGVVIIEQGEQLLAGGRQAVLRAVAAERLGERVHALPQLAVLAPHHHQRQDRKSTRLNSSHVKISYAVFCLKKKK